MAKSKLMSISMPADETAALAALAERLIALDRERAAIVTEIDNIRSATRTAASPASTATIKEVGATVNLHSSNEAKIALFRSLFRGRTDVFPIRWENTKVGRSGYAPACANEWVREVCNKPRVKCSVCSNQAFIPVDDAAIERHLRGTKPNGGSFVMGVYPMLADDNCWFLAADFDEGEWRRDVQAFAASCRRNGIPVAIERSRSGNGAHAWVFFAEALPAIVARRLGAYLVTETMETVPDIGFKSYDRFFPSQDTMPAGGFGNLIALPLQGFARASGNSLFIDDRFFPYPDQWAFLSKMERLARSRVDELVNAASESGKILAVRIPLSDEDEEPWLAPPSRRRSAPWIVGKLPDAITLIQADQIYVPRAELPPSLITSLARLAAFQNPEFYAAQTMRRPTYGKPRIISCAELTSEYIALPRGCFDTIRGQLNSLGVSVSIEDHRVGGTPISIEFVGDLRLEQNVALAALAPYDAGVLAATTAFGKTIVAIRMIVERGVNTLVVVHRQLLLDQWIERLVTFTNLPREAIGVIGAGRRKPKGQIDIALIQSLVRKGEVDDIVGGYGHVIVDECHHVSAVSFELAARRVKARYVLGLSATMTRKDGHHPIIAMQCGTVRHRANGRTEAAKRPFDHLVRIRETGFTLQIESGASLPPIQEVFGALATDEARNSLIFDDVLRALEAGRSPVVITERTDHLKALATRLERFAKNVVTLRGGQSAKQRRETALRLAQILPKEERVLVATGRYLGEGFDDSRLDTLFLTMPVAWKGTLAQYAGRLHRLHDSKREVVIYDYVDKNVPVLARMAAKRRAGYHALGYQIVATDQREFNSPMSDRGAPKMVERLLL